MSIDKFKEAVLAVAWKRVGAWAFGALLTLGISTATLGRTGIDYAVRQSDSFQQLKERVEATEASVQQSGRVTTEFLGAMMDVNPELRAAVEARARANEVAAAKRARDSAILHQLGAVR